MAIRNTAKAIIIKDGCVLLNKCAHRNGTPYYDLPGGGQHPYEPLEEGVLREVREETGYEARILRFCGLAEDICCEWIPFDRVASLPLRPIGIAPFIAQMICSDTPIYIPTFFS